MTPPDAPLQDPARYAREMLALDIPPAALAGVVDNLAALADHFARLGEVEEA